MSIKAKRPSSKVVPENSIRIIPLKRRPKINALHFTYMTLVICSLSYLIGFIIVITVEDKRAQNIDIHLISWGAFLIGFCVLNITILFLAKCICKYPLNSVWDYIDCLCIYKP